MQYKENKLISINPSVLTLVPRDSLKGMILYNGIKRKLLLIAFKMCAQRA